MVEPSEDKGAIDVSVDISETAFVSEGTKARRKDTEPNSHTALRETSAPEVEGQAFKATKSLPSELNGQKNIAEQVEIRLLNGGTDSPRFGRSQTPGFGRSQSLPAYKSEESAGLTPNTGRSDDITQNTAGTPDTVSGSDKETLVSSTPASPKPVGMRKRRQSLADLSPTSPNRVVGEQSDPSSGQTPRSQTDRSVSAPSSASKPRAKGQRRRTSLTQQTANTPSEALQVIIENPGKITDFYTFKKKVLGKGSYGSVKIATLASSGAKRAIKSIQKRELTHNRAIIEEIQVLKRIDHLHIVKLYETFEDDTTLFLVMALSDHGNMTKHIKTLGHLNHNRCKDSMRHLVSAVNYLHNNYIAHRDVKPDNVLIHTLNPLSLRLTDFGLAKRFKANQVFTSEVGTPCFMAPEVFRKRYTQVADVWSCGITMYFLLCGYLPFTGSSEEEIKQSVLHKTPSYSTAEWADVAADTWAFLDLMLKKNPRVRYTADQTFHHDWLNLKRARSSDPNPVELSRETLDHLQTFRKGNKLKRSALLVIASMLKFENTLSGHKVFVSLDTNGDGQISLSEMRIFMKSRMKASEVDLMFEQDISLDTCEIYGAKAFSYTEFIAATFDRKDCITQAIAKAAFAMYDKDGDGRISMEELSSGQLLGHLSLEEVAKTLEDLDSNGDCFIDFDEFKAMLYT